MKQLTITNRELVHHWAKWKAKLCSGEAHKLLIPENGHRYVITIQQTKKQPGDIRELLDRLETLGPYDVKKVRIPWTLKSLKTLKRKKNHT